MSKMDSLRALREARYAQEAAAGTKAAGLPKATRPQPARATDAPRPAGDPEVPDASLCGHRSMNGRTCTREHGHSAKSHRYS
jgi:hypothetical protein